MRIRYYWYEDKEDGEREIVQIIHEVYEDGSGQCHDYYFHGDDCPMESWKFKKRYKLLERIKPCQQ